MRPVDAEALEKKISEWLGQPGNGDYYSGYDAALCAVQDLIADTPTLTPPNEPMTMEQAKKEKHIWFEPLKDWGKVTPDGVLFFGTEERMRWETLNEYWGDPFKVYRYPPEGEA